MKHLKRTGLPIAIGVAVVAFVAIISQDKSLKKESPSIEADSSILETPIPVQVWSIQTEPFLEAVVASGVLEAWRRAVLSSETGGRALEWKRELGEKLNAGDELLALDPQPALLQLAAAEAALKSAASAAVKQRIDIERARRLFNQGELSENALEGAELALKTAEAALAGAESSEALAHRALSETSVRMPFDGRLASRIAVVGQTTAPGMPIAEVVQTDSMKLTVHISESSVNLVRVGSRMLITVRSISQSPLEGRVHAVGAAADALSRLFPVETAIPNPDDELKPGMTCRVEIITAEYLDATAVPLVVVRGSDSGFECFILRGDRAVGQRVSLGGSRRDMVRIESGILPGDTLILTVTPTLQSGQRVTLDQRTSN